MTFALRNTLIILALVVILAGFGLYFVSFKLSNEVEDFEEQLDTKNKELETLQALNVYFDDIEKQLNALRDNWKIMPKRFFNEENTAVSFAYFNRLARENNSRMFYDFSSNITQKFDSVTVTNYSLIGDAIFVSLYNFIWKLENYSQMYVIEKLMVKPLLESDKPLRFGVTRVEFSMTIKSYSINQNQLVEQTDVPAPRLARITYSPFYPLIKETLPPPEDDQLIADDLILLGLTENTAFVQDAGKNSHILRIGDPVYLGYLTRIILEENAIEFTLNEGGFSRKVKIKMFQDK